MSGGGGGPIIIPKLVEVPTCTPQEKALLLNILNRSPVRCTIKDALRVAHIVFKLLRRA